MTPRGATLGSELEQPFTVYTCALCALRLALCTNAKTRGSSTLL